MELSSITEARWHSTLPYALASAQARRRGGHCIGGSPYIIVALLPSLAHICVRLQSYVCPVEVLKSVSVYLCYDVIPPHGVKKKDPGTNQFDLTSLVLEKKILTKPSSVGGESKLILTIFVLQVISCYLHHSTVESDFLTRSRRRKKRS